MAMIARTQNRNKENHTGFSLVEFMVAMVVLMIGLLGTLALFTHSLVALGFSEMNIVAKVVVLDPPAVLVGVSSACPSPHGFEDGRIHRHKGFVAHNMAVKVRPSSYFGVEQGYQRVCRCSFVSFDGFSDVRQERGSSTLNRLSLPKTLVRAW